ncbi:hypothetical protein CLV98_1115 [Dyadobacter jejuensis]|uniref:Uncharacterized protein n=1 Tax=Dyadobacter jejuensis TaxID=1082580 RepID=A0A316AFZ4_9BACT|nr:hypothetical protein CLV98_1115 [Dyadobacter jejuensis]
MEVWRFVPQTFPYYLQARTCDGLIAPKRFVDSDKDEVVNTWRLIVLKSAYESYQEAIKLGMNQY